MDTRWLHPFTAILAGPSKCGKSYFVRRFLKYLSAMCTVKFDRVLFFYGEWQNFYREFEGPIEFHEGTPQTADYSNDNHKTKLIILDDLMRESSGDVVLDLFTKNSHHKNLSVIFITQNLFYQGKSSRDISLNTTYMVIFKNPRDRAQIKHLARQVYPQDSKFLWEAYLDATREPHSYLFLDLSQEALDEFRVRTCIFPDDEKNYAYVPKKS